MNIPDAVTLAEDSRARSELNRWLSGFTANQRAAWALENLAGNHAMSSSFGAQSAVLLHLMTRLRPDLPVLLIDTGHLFPETYRFIDELQERLRLNLKVFTPNLSSAWSQARHGALWQ